MKTENPMDNPGIRLRHQKAVNQPHVKKAQSEANKKRWEEPGEREKQAALLNQMWEEGKFDDKYTPEVRKKLSDAMKKGWAAGIYDESLKNLKTSCPTKAQLKCQARIEKTTGLKCEAEYPILRYRADICIPNLGLVVEYNGSGHYIIFDVKQPKPPVEVIWGNDMRRALNMTRYGWTVMHIEHDDYANDMKETIKIIQEEIETNGIRT